MTRILLAALLPVSLGCGVQSGPAPRVVDAVSMETVAFSPKGETLHAALYRPAGDGPFPAIIVVHGDFGLTPWVQARARYLASKGFVTLAVDLYRGEAVGDVMDAHIMGRGLADDVVASDLKAATDYLVGRADVRAGALGIIGWGLGGGYALDAAILDSRFRAVATCYGRLTTDADVLRSLNAAVIGIFGDKDPGISRDTIEQFRSAMLRAGKRVADLHVYPNCDHGFMEPSHSSATTVEQTAATADAWERIDAFFAAELAGRR